MGVPSVRREVHSYLTDTLSSLMSELSAAEKEDCVIVVLIAEVSGHVFVFRCSLAGVLKVTGSMNNPPLVKLAFSFCHHANCCRRLTHSQAAASSSKSSDSDVQLNPSICVSAAKMFSAFSKRAA